jgi:hypothetical protein
MDGMNKNQKELLKKFQTGYNRRAEEAFAQILTERADIRLFFINENRCFTDGKNIIIDPAEQELYIDRKALEDAENYLNLDNSISADPWLALKMQTRASNIHESLHIIYTDFPLGILSDKRSTGKARIAVLSIINNLIEDAFIEAAGCSVYDNLEQYLVWNRVALFYSNKKTPNALETAFIQSDFLPEPVQRNESENRQKRKNGQYIPVMAYLQYMCVWLLYPFYAIPDPPESIKEYVEDTKTLYSAAAVCGNAGKRYEYVQKIFDAIAPLIPDSEDITVPASLNNMLSGMKTHSAENASIGNTESKGREAVITRRLFTDIDGNPLPQKNAKESNKEKIETAIKQFLKEKEYYQEFPPNTPSVKRYTSGDFDCSNLHRNINLEVIKPAINRNFRRAYQNLLTKYHLTIHSYSSRLSQYLKADVEEKEEKKLFGAGVSSKYFADIKKRYWYKKEMARSIPEISFLFLIDGSGSMEGERRTGVISAMVIIHEVLKANAVQHSIVEHRAIYYEPKLIHNILVDFNYREDEKYNILSIEADEGTREGFTLYWAERHIQKSVASGYKVIIMVSDGEPAHACDEEPVEYVPPVSVKDSAEAVKKITRRGTPIIALALDSPGSGECYRQLTRIYPDAVSCVDIHTLPGKLLNIISRIIQGGLQ